MELTLDEVLGPDGSLARAVPGFAPRAGQIDMAHRVLETIQEGGFLVVEAGTGIGKTFAYLAPALISGVRTVVSTGTRNLQDQLYHDDIPRITKACGRAARVEQLKGRSNYLCHYRLERTPGQNQNDARRLKALRMWAAETETGDLAEFRDLPDRDVLRPRVTSTLDNCLNAKCPDFERCFVVKARRRAQDADIVIVNHHLLCADLALKDEGFGEILPQADVLIIDEAHQLPGVLSQFFGFGISARQLRDLLNDAGEALAEFGDMPSLQDALGALAESLQLLDRNLPGEGARQERAELLDDARAADDLDDLHERLARLSKELEEVAGRGPALAQGWRRAAQAQVRLRRWLSDEPNAEDTTLVRWADRSRAGFALHAVPLDIAPTMQRIKQQLTAAWVLTSATLTVGRDFGHFCQEMGLEDATTEEFPSPFDYANNALLYHPRDMPDPNSPGFPARLLDETLALIAASRGGAFVLCTSLRAVDRLGDQLKRSLDLTVLVQGERSRNHLLREFREDGNAVLVATSSFWEGVDVRGSALRLVIIDRLPFASPDDPVLRAREDVLRAAGQSVFQRYQLPRAVLALKQGVGRLIRDVDDRGVVMLADSRIRSRSYGKVFINSLPPMARTQDRDQVCAFLKSVRSA